MNKEELKKAIVEEMEQCDNKDVLLDVLLKFYPHSEVEEIENSVEETEASYAASNAFKLPNGN